MKKIALPILAILVFSLSGCGQAGTWEDDPQNWTRAFRSQKPEDVNVLHSWYWRSPHFTYEFQYFFEVESNEEFKNQLISQNNLEKLEGKETKAATRNFLGEKPDWFIPKEVEIYDIYIFADEPGGHFRFFIDRDSGNMFLTDYQV